MLAPNMKVLFLEILNLIINYKLTVMKKVFTSLLLLTVALCSWAEESDPNPKFEEGTLTITYEDGLDFNNILEDSWKGNVTKLVLIGGFTNEFFSAEGPAENLVNQCTNSSLYLDLEQCTGIASKVVSTDGSDEIDWSDPSKYKYTTPNLVKVVELEEWFWDEAGTNKFWEDANNIREGENGTWWYYRNGTEGPYQVYRKVQQGYYLNGNFTPVNPEDVDDEGFVTLEGEGKPFSLSKIRGKLNGITFPKNNEEFTAIPAELLNADNDNLKKVVISEGILAVESKAFKDAKNLTDLDFGTTLQNIEDKAFEASGLEGALELPTSLVEIKGDAFKECTSITDVIIPENAALEHIYTGAFLMDTPGQTAGGSLKNVYVNCNKEIICDKGAFGFSNTDGQTQAGTVTTRLFYPAEYYEHYVGAYKTDILGGIFDDQTDRLANRNYARAETSVTGVDGQTYSNTDYPNGNGWWEFLSTGIPVPYNKDWVVDYEDYWRTYSDIVDLIVPTGFDESEDFNSDEEKARAGKGINVYIVDGFDEGKARLVRMKVGDVIPANTGVVIHWRAKITDTSGGFIFFAPALENMEGYGNDPYDNELYPTNLYKGYKNYMKPLNTRGEEQRVENVEKDKRTRQPLYRNFFWGNSKEYEEATQYKGKEFDQAGVSGWGFYRAVTAKYKINNKAYLHFPADVYDNDKGAGSGEDHNTDTNANAFSFVIVGEETNGITNLNVNTTVTDDSYYTLQGVKMSAPAERGIYIHNGKKIILK